MHTEVHMSIQPADLSEPFDDLLYERDGHIARITLNRPERGNALTAGMQARIRAVWDEVRENPEIRVAIITAAGERHFSTGADVGIVAESGRVSAGDGPMSDEVFWSPRQNRVWKPVVVAVNGVANGGGLHLVVDSDIVVASTNATFMDTHVNVGMVGAIENIGLTKRLPMGTALRMTLQGKAFRLSAERAYQLGLVDELVEPAELLSTAEQIAQDIAKNSPHAVTLSKQALWSAQEMGYHHAMEYGWALLRMHWAHPDFAEGPRAFAERRDPEWTV
jgi:enoyl-CoA hydratase/carnithine racemase